MRKIIGEYFKLTKNMEVNFNLSFLYDKIYIYLYI